MDLVRHAMCSIIMLTYSDIHAIIDGKRLYKTECTTNHHAYYNYSQASESMRQKQKR